MFLFGLILFGLLMASCESTTSVESKNGSTVIKMHKTIEIPMKEISNEVSSNHSVQLPSLMSKITEQSEELKKTGDPHESSTMMKIKKVKRSKKEKRTFDQKGLLVGPLSGIEFEYVVSSSDVESFCSRIFDLK